MSKYDSKKNVWNFTKDDFSYCAPYALKMRCCCVTTLKELFKHQIHQNSAIDTIFTEENLRWPVNQGEIEKVAFVMDEVLRLNDQKSLDCLKQAIRECPHKKLKEQFMQRLAGKEAKRMIFKNINFGFQ